jgi:hypothetical protein
MLRQIFCFLIVLFFLPCNVGFAQFYQGSNLQFGKSRVQYRDFEWSYYNGKFADVYFYQGGEKLALETTQKADKIMGELATFLGFEPRERLYIMVYLSQSDMRQTNIGSTPDENNLIIGSSPIIQNKLFVYFEGNHEEYQKQLQEGLAQIAIHQVLYGGSWKDAIREAAFSSYPDWYLKGLGLWLAKPNNELLDVFMIKELEQRKPQFNFWKEDEARYGGAAFWTFIADRYGYHVIPNILQMSKFARGVDMGFELIIGKTLEQIVNEFYEFYLTKLQRMSKPEDVPSDEKLRKCMGEIDLKYKKKFIYRDFHESPDLKYWTFVTHEKGQYRIWLYDKSTGKASCLVKRQPKLDRIEDLTYPVTCWHPSSETFCYFYEKKGFLRFAQFALADKKWNEKEIFSIDKVLYPRFSKDGKNIVFVGITSGKTDVFILPTIANAPKALTKTEDDDFSPVILPNKKVVYLSQSKDPKEEKPYYLSQVDMTGGKSERIFESRYPLRFAFGMGEEEMGCTEEHPEGIKFLRIKWDSVIASIDTTIHYRKAPMVREFDQLPFRAHVFEGPTSDSSWNFYHGYVGHVQVKKSKNRSALVTNKISFDDTESIPMDTLRWIKRPIHLNKIDLDNFLFSEERMLYSKEKSSLVLSDSTSAKKKKKVVTDLKRSNYDLNFATDFATTKLDNTFASTFYQNASSGPTSIFPGMSGLVKVSISDLLEDYRMYAAVRVAADIRNSDFGISFENNKDQLDKKTTFQRRSQRWGGLFNAYRLETYMVTQQWKYPFNEFHCVRLNLIYRWDRRINLSVDPVSLADPNSNENNVGVLAEYLLDNTRNIGLNLLEGTRGKLWYEYYQQPDNWTERTDMHILGGDFRHYKKIHRSIIAAFRFAGATSFGSRKVVHYLGGVDNWLFQRVDQSTVVSDQMNYRFASFCGPMRGFYINARNGNNFLAANTEIRIPIFSYLSRTPIRSDFVKHFQVIGFGDVGSAWTGKSPYDASNGFNTNTVTQKPVTVTVNSNREPVIYGYGFGVRSKVLGYFLRADWAWGIDDGQILPRVFYLSLNMDF